MHLLCFGKIILKQSLLNNILIGKIKGNGKWEMGNGK